MAYLWTLFKGSVQRWNEYLRYLQGTYLDEEKQLITQDYLQEDSQRSIPSHTAFKSYDELSFRYNLDGKALKQTSNQRVNDWISDFGQLNIDIYTMILQEQTLPDAAFLQKRYISRQKEVHPDRPGGSGEQSTNVNLAKEKLDLLYESVRDQITLFQAVFASAPPLRPPSGVIPQVPNTIPTTPLVILYLGGAGLGLVLVLSSSKRNKKK